MACHWPLRALAPDGALVEWATTRILVPRPRDGQPITMNGRTEQLSIQRTGCEAIGGDEAIKVWVPVPGPSATLSNIEVFACLRGPDLATTEAQVRRMLESAHLGS